MASTSIRIGIGNLKSALSCCPALSVLIKLKKRDHQHNDVICSRGKQRICLALILVFALAGIIEPIKNSFVTASPVTMEIHDDFVSSSLFPFAEMAETRSLDIEATDIASFSEGFWRYASKNQLDKRRPADVALWLKFRLNNYSGKDLTLDMGQAGIDHLGLYEILDNDASGFREVNLLPEDGESSVIRISGTPNTEQAILVRIVNEGTLSINPSLWETEAFYRHKHRSALWTGAGLGLWLSFLITSLVIIVIYRRPASVSFGGLLLFWGFYAMIPEGLANDLGLNPRNIEQISILSLAAGMLFLAALASQVFDLRKNLPVIFRLIQIESLTLVLCCFVAPFFSLDLVERVISIAGLVTVFTIFGGIFERWIAGNKQGFYTLFSISPLLLVITFNQISMSGLWEQGQVANLVTAFCFVYMCTCLGMILLIRLISYVAHDGKNTGMIWAQRVRGNLLENRVEQLTQANDTLREYNTIDPLTGVRNRRFFDINYEQEWRRATRAGYSLTMILIDIDHFKNINDQHGHLAGDECLKTVAKTLVGLVKRPGDMLARYGGEEFVAVLPHTSNENVSLLMESVLQNIRHIDIPCDGTKINLTISAGICTVVPTEQMKAEELFSLADAALYQAKEAGRNLVVNLGFKQKDIQQKA